MKKITIYMLYYLSLVTESFKWFFQVIHQEQKSDLVLLYFFRIINYLAIYI